MSTIVWSRCPQEGRNPLLVTAQGTLPPCPNPQMGSEPMIELLLCELKGQAEDKRLWL